MPRRLNVRQRRSPARGAGRLHNRMGTAAGGACPGRRDDHRLGGESPVDQRIQGGAAWYAAVEHDSLVGWVAPAWDSKAGPLRHAYALGEVREVAVKKNDFGPNVVLGVVAGTALFFGTVMSVWAISCATSYCD